MDSLSASDLEPYQWQIAGHQISKTGEKRYVGLLRDKKNRRLLKPQQQPPRGECEVQFYERIWKDGMDQKDPLYSLRPFLPKYYGMRNVSLNGISAAYMELEDATATMKKPCIADIKIGAQTWDPNASKEKIQTERNKYGSYAERLGFRLLGMMVYQPKTEDYVIHDKSWGKNVKEDEIPNCFAEYFNAAGDRAQSIIDRVLEKLRAIEQWFSEPKGYAFYSSSVLLAYDAVIDDQHLPQAEVRMIDFTHVFDDHQGCDNNYLNGLKGVIRFIEMQKTALSNSPR